MTELSISFDYLSDVAFSGPTTPVQDWFGLLRFRSPLLSESLLFSSPPGTKMFQFPGFSSLKLCFGLRMITHFLVIGFPHSDTPGSLNVYFSPRRFAVFCVLLLLYMPRHPPYALLHLITLLENFWLNCFFLSLKSFSQLFRKTYLLCLSCYSVFKELSWGLFLSS